MTTDDIFAEALLLNGVIYPGQTISAEAKATCLLGLNMMLGEWNATGLAVYSVVRTAPFALVSGTADYTIGATGTIAIARPEKIEAWAVASASGPASSGEPVDAATFLEIAKDRSATAALIQALNYDAAFPLGTIHLYPKPNGGSLELWVWQQFTDIADTTAAVALPPGYLQALVYNLAVRIASKFGQQVLQGVQKGADESKAALGGVNSAQHRQAPAKAA